MVMWAVAITATSPDELLATLQTLTPGIACAVGVLVLGAVFERSRHLADPTQPTTVPAADDHTGWRVSRSGGTATEILGATIGGRQRALAERQCDVLERIQIAVAEGRDPGSDVDALQRLIYRGHRMGQTLLVLAANEPGATRVGPSLLDDVILDALADHDGAERVDATSIDWCVVRADVADDLAHLIAELLDNALESSPTSTAVSVVGRWSNNDYSLSIMDEGIGIDRRSRARANDVLASGGSIDAGHGRSFGLSTVARLAQRHDIRVRVLESPTDGLLAKIHLPVDVLVDSEPAHIDSNLPPTVCEPLDLLDLDDDGFDRASGEPVIHLDDIDGSTSSTWRTTSTDSPGMVRPSVTSPSSLGTARSAAGDLVREHRAQVVPIDNASRRTRV